MNSAWYPRSWKWLVASCLSALLLACGGGDDAPPPPTPGQATIGVAGGEVTGPDGVKIIVPEGAFTQDTTVRVARNSSDTPEVGGLRLLTPIYQVTPHGGDFESPARILIPFNAADRHSDTAPVIIRTQPGADHWEVLQTDVDGGLAAADSFGFSYYAVGECYVARDYTVGGWDPIASCPSGHTLRLQMRDAGGNPVAILRSPAGTLQPLLTITEPTPVVVQLDWLRPSGTSRTDRIELGVTSKKPAGLVKDLQVNHNTFSLVAGDIIDPSDYTGALAPGGQRVNISAYASYEFDAFYPACQCFRPTSWIYSTHLLLKAVSPGTAPIINQQPANQSVLQGESASFSVMASGARLSYQWQRSAPGASTFTDLPGATSSSLVTGAATTADSGARYRVHVCAAGASRPCVDSDAATLTVSKTQVMPGFTLQPASISIVTGQTASFSVRASGEPAPTVQWYRAGASGDVAVGSTCPADPSGTTECHYTTPVLDESDSGSEFYARAENTMGHAQSVRAKVTVTSEAVAPTLDVNLSSQSVGSGGSATFTVEVSGTAPISYQWYRDGQPIPGANGATLTLDNLSSADDGATIYVVVTNAGGSATSNTVTLSVHAPVCSAPVQINDTAYAAVPATLLMDSTGNATALWSQNLAIGSPMQLRGSRYNVGNGTWDPLPAMGARSGTVSSAGPDGAGGLLMLVQDDSTYFYRVLHYGADGSWSEPAGWAGSTGSEVAASVAVNGTAVTVWVDSTDPDSLYAQRYEEGAWSGDPVRLNTAATLISHPLVAQNSSGKAVAAWIQRTNGDEHGHSPHYHVWSSQYDGSAWSTPQNIGGVEIPILTQLAMNEAGQAVVTWSDSHDDSDFHMAARYVNGSWGAAVALDQSADDANDFMNSHQTDINSNGAIVSVWRRGQTIHARRYAAGAWGPAIMLNQPAGIVDEPRLSLAPNGSALIAWSTLEDLSTRDTIIHVNRMAPDGTWSGQEQVTRYTDGSQVAAALAALHTTGAFTLIWSRSPSQGSQERVEAVDCH